MVCTVDLRRHIKQNMLPTVPVLSCFVVQLGGQGDARSLVRYTVAMATFS